MSYRGRSDGMRHGESSRMMGLDGDKMSRSDMDDLGRGSRPPFSRGRRHSPGRDKSHSDRGRDYGGFGRDVPMGRDRSPIRGGFEDRFGDRDRFKRDDMRDDHIRKERGRFLEDSFRDKFPEDRGRFETGGFGSKFDMLDDLMKTRQPSRSFLKNDMVRPNECEIIVVNKSQRVYAENIEARMKNLGIIVDILFLKDEALLVQTIDDIARRGCLYAIVINSLNETHSSVTLNILHGTPQEHRNMPLDDALKLVARNFHDHIRSQKETMDRDRQERGVSGPNPADQQMQFLFRLLVEGRQLSIGEIDNVIKFLTDRRDKMKVLQGETSSLTPAASDVSAEKPKAKVEIDLAQKEQDLQNRIMRLMNQGDIGANDGNNSSGGSPQIKHRLADVNVPSIDSDVIGAPSQPKSGSANEPNSNQQGGSNNNNQASSSYINFDNPSVKKALDSLMQSGPGLLKSLSGGSPSTTQGMPTDSSNKVPGGMGPQRGGMEQGPRGGVDQGPRRGMDGMRGGLDQGPRGGMDGMRGGLDQGPRGGMDGMRGGLDQGPRGGMDGARGGLDQGPRSGMDGQRGGMDQNARGGMDQGPRGGMDQGPRGGMDQGPRGGMDQGPRGGMDQGPRGGMDGPRGHIDQGPQSGNMPFLGGGLGNLQNRSMGMPENRGMGMQQGMGMNQRQGLNMGPSGAEGMGGIGGMGHRSGGPFQDRPNMFGNNNMMDNRQTFMGGSMGNQGMGGGPRRY